LEEKEIELVKMREYVGEYEKLGVKNKKMEGEMQEILCRLIEIKDKEEYEKEMIKC
jgi:hypothetical protein